MVQDFSCKECKKRDICKVPCKSIESQLKRGGIKGHNWIRPCWQKPFSSMGNEWGRINLGEDV